MTNNAAIQGHRIDVSEFLGDVMRSLALLFSASDVYAWRNSGVDDGGEPLQRVRSVFAEYQIRELPRLLLGISVVLRAKLNDSTWRVADERVIAWMSDGDSVNPERGASLSLREVCNKMIHAIRVEYDPRRHEDGTTFMGSQWILYGELQGKAWAAQVNVLQFLVAAANLEFEPGQ